MNRILILLLLVASFTYAQSDTIPAAENNWKRVGEITFLFNQSSFSEWVSGGENSVALSCHVDYDWSFEKNGWKWDTKFLGDLGLTKISGTKY